LNLPNSGQEVEWWVWHGLEPQDWWYEHVELARGWTWLEFAGFDEGTEYQMNLEDDWEWPLGRRFQQARSSAVQGARRSEFYEARSLRGQPVVVVGVVGGQEATYRCLQYAALIYFAPDLY
jgi:hypothetical protein